MNIKEPRFPYFWKFYFVLDVRRKKTLIQLSYHDYPRWTFLYILLGNALLIKHNNLHKYIIFSRGFSTSTDFHRGIWLCKKFWNRYAGRCQSFHTIRFKEGFVFCIIWRLLENYLESSLILIVVNNSYQEIKLKSNFKRTWASSYDRSWKLMMLLNIYFLLYMFFLVTCTALYIPVHERNYIMHGTLRFQNLNWANKFVVFLQSTFYFNVQDDLLIFATVCSIKSYWIKNNT